MDMTIPKAIVKGLPVCVYDKNSPASKALIGIASRISQMIFLGVE